MHSACTGVKPARVIRAIAPDGLERGGRGGGLLSGTNSGGGGRQPSAGLGRDEGGTANRETESAAAPRRRRSPATPAAGAAELDGAPRASPLLAVGVVDLRRDSRAWRGDPAGVAVRRAGLGVDVRERVGPELAEGAPRDGALIGRRRIRRFERACARGGRRRPALRI